MVSELFLGLSARLGVLLRAEDQSSPVKTFIGYDKQEENYQMIIDVTGQTLDLYPCLSNMVDIR